MKPFTKEYTVLIQKPLIASAANRLLQTIPGLHSPTTPLEEVWHKSEMETELVKRNFYTHIFKHFLMILARNPSSW